MTLELQAHHIQNLQSLRDHLARLPQDTPTFSMKDYFKRRDEFLSPWEARRIEWNPEGKFCACAAGHLVFVSPNLGAHETHHEICWVNYIKAATGLNNLMAESSRAHQWLFSGGWADCANTPGQAATRIALLLEIGAAPTGWRPVWLQDRRPVWPRD